MKSGGTNMKDIKKKIEEYDKLLDQDSISDPIADQVLMDLDSMINRLEDAISDKLDNMYMDDEDISDWDVTLMDGLDEEE